jgi:hypothetical protein
MTGRRQRLRQGHAMETYCYPTGTVGDELCSLDNELFSNIPASPNTQNIPQHALESNPCIHSHREDDVRTISSSSCLDLQDQIVHLCP